MSVYKCKFCYFTTLKQTGAVSHSRTHRDRFPDSKGFQIPLTSVFEVVNHDNHGNHEHVNHDNHNITSAYHAVDDVNHAVDGNHERKLRARDSPASEVSIFKESVKVESPQIKPNLQPNLTSRAKGKTKADYAKFLLIFAMGSIIVGFFIWRSNLFGFRDFLSGLSPAKPQTEPVEEDAPFDLDVLKNDIASQVVYINKN